MEPGNSIVFKLNKFKLTLMLLGSIAFVAVGVWFVWKRPVSNFFLLSTPLLVLITGIAAILLFGLLAFLIAKKLTETEPGLVISDEGITDNSGHTSVGMIPWSDIIEIRAIKVANQDLLMIMVKNPEEYINRQTGGLKRRIMTMNATHYGTPISISANGLSCSFDTLYRAVTGKFNSKNQSMHS